jgi:DNA-binding protein HU-beta
MKIKTTEELMNKGQLIEHVAKKTGISKTKAALAVNAVFDAISATLKKGKRVQLVGFGSFLVRKRKARIGRNPQSGETIKIAAKKVPAFSAGAALKSAVSGK